MRILQFAFAEDATHAYLPHNFCENTVAYTGTGLNQFASTTSLQLAGVISDETGSGALVFGTSPTLTTPVLGVATATSINKLTITAPATSATLTVADGKTLTASNTLTFTGTDASSVAFGTGGTVAYTSNKLSVFAATTSAELAGVISDETGSGALVFGTSPSLTTSVTTGSTTFAVFDTTATTIDAFGAATTLSLGHDGTAASTTNIATGALASGTKAINLGTGASAGTTNVTIGAANAGTTTVNSPTLTVGTGATVALGTTSATATTINFMTGLSNASAKTLNIGTGATNGALTTIIGGSVRLAGHASAGFVKTDASGNLSVVSATYAAKYAVDVGDGSSTSITVTHNLGTTDVQVSVFDKSGTFDQVYPDARATTSNTVTLVFNTAPTSAQYRCIVMG
jgi:hypothetical protein